MKKRTFFKLFLIIIFLIFSSSAFADIFCNKCGHKNPDGSKFCNICGTKLADIDALGHRIEVMLDHREIDSAISLLRDLDAKNPDNFTITVLLAKALLVKCEALKEKGDEKYEELVYEPFNMGKELITKYGNNYPKLAEGLFICAKSYFINHRACKAGRYVAKAIKLAPGINEHAEYYLLYGDTLAKESHKERNSFETSSNEYDRAITIYKDVIAQAHNERIRGIAYYKLGVLLAYFGEKQEARKAFNQALTLVDDSFWQEKINEKL